MRAYRNQHPGLGFLCLALLIAGCSAQASPSDTGGSPEPSPSSLASASASDATPSPSEVTSPAHWQPAGSLLGEPTSGTHVHALGDGRVLAVHQDTTAELWDPTTSEWQATAQLNNPRTSFASVALPDGRVLVAGGLNDDSQSYSSAYLFDPATESWEKAAGLMNTARTSPSAAVLPDGRVLLVGGYFHEEPEYGTAPGGTVLAAMSTTGPGPGSRGGSADVIPGPFGAALATAEIFDPATGQWSSTGSMRYARNGPAITPLTDGRILVVGSLDYLNTGVEIAPGAVTTAEIYDPATGQFSAAGEFPALDLSGAADAGFDLGGFTVSHVGQLAPLADGGAILVDHYGYWKHQGIAVRSLRFDAEGTDWHEIGDTYIYVEEFGTGTTYESPVDPRLTPAAAVLTDGRVLVAGGTAGAPRFSDTLASAVLYDPATDSWTSLPDMPEPRAGAASVVLDDGSVLLVGGTVSDSDGTIQPLRSALLFIPAS